MHIKKYMSSASNLFAENRLFRFVLALMLILIIFLVIQNNRLATSYKVILVPPNINEKITIENDVVDKKYMEAMGGYIANLMYNFTLDTVKAQYNILLDMFAPEAKPKYLDNFMALMKKYNENGVTMVFRITDIKLDTAKKVITVSGKTDKYVLNNMTESANVSLSIHFRINNGLFQIVDMEKSEK